MTANAELHAKCAFVTVGVEVRGREKGGGGGGEDALDNSA